MRTFAILPAAGAALIVAGLADAREGRLRDRLGASRADGPAAPAAAGKQTLAYGSDRLQQLDFYPAKNARGPAPLVLFVHGGGWKRGSKDNADGSWKAPHYTEAGYAYASINYRLVPDATVEQQGADVAAALRFLIDRAGTLGIDRSRVVLMGHSAGAHLVALVGTDERYLKGAGLSLRDIDGVLPIDGAAYDVARQMADGGRMMQDTYVQAFGTDPSRQAALSPTLQAQAPNAGAFLVIHVQRRDGVAQSKALEEALRAGGTPAERRDFPGRGLTGHAEINRQLGNPDYVATPVVDAWLARVLAR
ncbi:acetyl esterase/lipase [Novosphingobium kunmingense]|uniref:Acetyl esterase/lipase n=1 Tax=Novosphingobium kunmingense TaxID=1211806 RepID=A0A2N0H679_9SPHN|nr:alpha/beta hydrolase [Novosphingobium kunmingense]PKB14409.1 acetyl esterase/lipase [Novosphingobium kunmingense]